MAGEIATAFVRIRPQTSSFKSEMSGQVGGATRSLAGQLAKTSAVLLGGATIAKGIQSIVKIGVAYRDSLNTFQAVSEATNTQMLGVSATAKRLGNDITIPGANASDAAVAMTELARSGLSVQDSMNAARGSLQLAAAGEVSATEAAQTMAGALNTFALAGTDATRVADLFSAAANNTAASIPDIAYGVQSAGSAAHAAGFNINELTTALGEMSNAGLSGETAGTSFRSLLISLEKPSAKASKALKQMGVSIYDQHGKMKPLVEIIGQFQAATKGMTAEQRNANFAQIAGTYGLSALNILVGKGTKSYLDLERANLKQGAASDLAKAKMTGLGGSVRGLQNTLETAAISVFQQFSPSLERAVLSVNHFVSGVTSGSGFGKVLAQAADFATTSFEQLVGMVQFGISALQTLAPAIQPVLNLLTALGTGPILVAIGTFKALSVATTIYGAAAGLIARTQTAQAASAAAVASAEARAAAAQQASATAAAELAVASNAAAAAQGRLSAASSTGGLSGLAGGLKGAAAEAGTLAGTAGRAAPAVERGGIAAAGASGSFRALATGMLGMVSPTTAVIGGVALLAGGLYWLSTQASSAEKAAKATADTFSRLVGTSKTFAAAQASLSQSRQNTSDAKLQREQATLGITVANQQLAADQKRHASNVTLQQDSINIRVAQEQWRSANAAVVKSKNDESAATRRGVAASKAHQVEIAKLTGTLAKQGQTEQQAVQRAAELKAIALGQGDAWDKNSAAAKAAAAAVSRYVTSAEKLAASQKGSAPVLSKATGFVAKFAQETKKIPTRTEVAFILNNTKAKTSFSDIKRGLDNLRKSKNEAKLGLDVNPFNQGAARVLIKAHGMGAPIGSNMSEGVVAGIQAVDIAGPLIAKVQAAVAAAKKKAINASSPSKVTADELGRPMMQGIALGLDVETPKTVITANKAALKVTGAFINTLKGFRKSAKAALRFDDVFTDNIRSAITSARDNLRTLGSTVSASLGTYLDRQNENTKLRLHRDQDPAIDALTDAIAKRAHDATVKSAAEAVTAAQNEVARLTAAGGPDAWASQAADDAIAETRESLQALQETHAEQLESLTDALTSAQADLKVAVDGVAGTLVAGKPATGTPGSAGSAGREVGSPFSSGTKIAGTYRPPTDPTTGSAGTEDTLTGEVKPLDALGQRAAARNVAQAQRALAAFEAGYQRSLHSSTKAVHDAELARAQLNTDYTEQVKTANEGVTTALAAQFDLQQGDLLEHLQKSLDADIKSADDATAAHKAALDQQLTDLADQLARKQISLEQFNEGVLGTINTYAPGWKESGSQLGTSFVSGIQDAIAGLLAQGFEITHGPNAPASSTSPVVSPRGVQATDAASLRLQLLDAKDTVKRTIRQLGDDQRDAVKKDSQGKGGGIDASEARTIADDKLEVNKNFKELMSLMKQILANAGRTDISIESLNVGDDPDAAVANFFKRLAASASQ